MYVKMKLFKGVFLLFFSMSDDEASSSESPDLQNAGVWQEMRKKLPLPVAMTILFGAVYLVVSDGIVFSPQLQYVRGPPPT